MIRGKLFTLNELQGSRAWFDFPVLAWLGACLDGGLLANLASALRLPLEFDSLQWEGNFLALPISAEYQGIILPVLATHILGPLEAGMFTGTSTGFAPATDKWCHGPFPAGQGMICATLDTKDSDNATNKARRADILAEATRLTGEPPRANVYSIALVELHWYPGPNYGSSWAILSSAVAGKVRSAGRPVH